MTISKRATTVSLLILFLTFAISVSAGEFDWVDIKTGHRRLADDPELELGGMARRVLDESGYISYDALKADSIPCSQRGASYYNCQPGAEANPYDRGCSAITLCRN